MAAHFNRDQIRAALALTDPSLSSFLDLETGQVVQIAEGDTSAAGQQLYEDIMANIGERYRYISGGNPNASDADVAAWLENEGLSE
ncbi:MAG: hypothetical protein DIU80_005140 [Chloroflexota bacterium]|nr:MAG: hypothetical protein DIU80_02210 [Chloroflexota bacterium]